MQIEVCELVNPTTSQYLTGLDKSDWFKHIEIILEASNFIMREIHEENVNVVVHCSDGWDRLRKVQSDKLKDSYNY
jgi:myotubularin-related protein 6/7/8